MSKTTTPAASALGITPGPWKVRDRTEVYAAGYFIGTTRGNHPEPESVMLQDAANAELIADAGTTTSACGLKPSELLARLREAVAIIIRIGYSCDDLGHRKDQYHNWDEPCPIVAEIDTFLESLPKP